MTSFEDSVRNRLTLATDCHQPPATDLEYYSRPENYAGAESSLQRFLFASRKHVPFPSRPAQPLPARVDDDDDAASGARTRLRRPLSAHAADDDEVRRDGAGQSGRERLRVRFRHGSVIVPSWRGSIQLQVRSTTSQPTSGRRTSGVDDNLPSGEDAQSERSPEVGRPEAAAVKSHETRWKEAVDRIKKPNAYLEHPAGYESPDTEVDQVKGARERFRHAIKTVVILLKWISSLTEKEEKSDKECYGRTFTDIASEAFSSGELKDSALSFDVSQFKANREINISNEVKSILSIPSHARTPEQLQTAIYGLQHLQSFAEYPLHMQEKLCKVAWFQEIPPKRIIIRQGHYAENFYFILSGQALVRILEKNPKTGEPQLRTATIMRKGTSFGELALLHHSRRTATVVSQETIQLLTIGRDDFFDIFMGGNAPGEIPEHIRFCSSLEFMKDWPIEKLLENPQCCLFHFFKRGVVIVKDSNQSDWLYIIKSGSCRVIKQLKGVVPRLEGSAKPKFRKEEYSPSLYGLFSEDIVPKVDTGLRRPHTRARTGRTPTPVQRARIEYHQLYSKNDDNVSKMSSVAKENSQQNVNLSRPGYSESKFKCYPQVKEAHFRKPKGGQLSATARTTNSNKHNPWLVSESLDRVQEDKLLVKEGALKGPVFVQVEVLKPKDVFGLATIRFDEDTDSERTSVSLVSNGAECIMFSKRFFMQHANEQVKKVVRHHAYRYPSEPALQENLQRKVDWELYKRKLIRDVIKNKRTNTMATI